jgi:hypothetical protein
MNSPFSSFTDQISDCRPVLPLEFASGVATIYPSTVRANDVKRRLRDFMMLFEIGPDLPYSAAGMMS